MMTAALAVVLVILVAGERLGAPRAAAGAPRHRPGRRAGAAAGRAVAGLSWAELGLGRAPCCAASSTERRRPGRRRGLRRRRRRSRSPGGRSTTPATGCRCGRAVLTSLVTIPLATVVFEEVAFRWCSGGWSSTQHGTPVATVASSALFGLWHVLPALDVARTSTAIRGGDLAGTSPGAPDRARHGRLHRRRRASSSPSCGAAAAACRAARPALGHQRPGGRGRRPGLGGQPAGVGSAGSAASRRRRRTAPRGRSSRCLERSLDRGQLLRRWPAGRRPR